MISDADSRCSSVAPVTWTNKECRALVQVAFGCKVADGQVTMDSVPDSQVAMNKEYLMAR